MKAPKGNIFATQFNEHERVFQESGSGDRVLYTSRLQDDGELEIVPSGKEDLYASIQSHKDSVDIHILLAKYRNGDENALSRVQGAYGDFTELPTSYAGLLNAVIAGENYFNSLPVDIRAKFDHSLEKFMVSMDDMPSFLEKLGVTTGSTEPVSEVKSDEGGVEE